MFYDIVSPIDGAQHRMLVKGCKFCIQRTRVVMISFNLPLKNPTGKLMILSQQLFS
jgi:hypothetical protein